MEKIMSWFRSKAKEQSPSPSQDEGKAVTADELFSGMYMRHLERMKRDGHFPEALCQQLVAEDIVRFVVHTGIEKMRLSLQDDATHSAAGTFGSFLVSITTCAADTQSLKSHYMRNGGYSTYLMNMYKSAFVETARISGCSTFVHVQFCTPHDSTISEIHMTLFPLNEEGKKYTALLPVDILDDEEKRNFGLS
jgi:hypothetical protein